MKVSLNWIKEFTDVNISVGELVEKIGAQLGAVEEVENLGEKYQSVVVAKVVSCVEHENSDHLHVCKIDDGGKVQNVERDENGHVQVVCGAPNVREGLTVAWLPPGATVPESYGKDPFVLEAREIRGQKSNGMLASARELALSDSHDGILEITEDAQAGDDFAKTYKLDDVIIDIENKMFTHRPDCFGMLGVAREVAGIQHNKFTSPDWYLRPVAMYEQGSEAMPLQVLNDITDIVPRFMAVTIKDVQIKPSPLWLQTYLNRSGIRPINNVVDVTNYMMLLTAQPLHAYDYDKVRSQDPGAETATIHVRYPVQGEKLKLLNGKEIEPRGGSIVIASATKAIGLGGIMGGAETEVDENTHNIILECASFDMYNIRRTSMEHGLFTDAVTRFTKGQSWRQNDRVLAKAIEMVRELSAGEPAGKQLKDSKSFAGGQMVSLTPEFVNERLGLKLSAEEMKQLLENVEFQVEFADAKLHVTAPFWRTDIEIPEDVVEEIGRLYGFDRLPLELPKRSIVPAKKDEQLELKSQIRAELAKAGSSEVLTYSFVHGNLLEKVGQDKTKAFQIANALSPDLQYYRLSLTPSLLEKVHPNIKAGYDEFAIFELGKVHYVNEWDENEPQIPNEDDHVSLVVAFNDKHKPKGAAYYLAKKYLRQIAGNLLLDIVPMTSFDFSNDEWGRQLCAPYEPQRSALYLKDGLVWGVVGEFKPSVKKALKLPEYCAGFEIGLAVLNTQNDANYTALSRFPKVEQDISLKVVADLPYGELVDLLNQKIGELKPADTIYDLTPLDIYQGDDKQSKHVTLRLSIASYEKTMRDAEVNVLLDNAAAAAREKFGAERL